MKPFARASIPVLILSTLLIAQSPATKAPRLEAAKLGKTRNVHVAGKLFLAGQFPAEDVSVIAARGIRRVISLRTEGELAWDEKAALRQAKLGLDVVSFKGPQQLTDAVFDSVRRLLRRRGKTLLHCGSANRVAAVWLPYRVLDQGVPLQTALAEAKTVGLRTPAYEQKARDYVRRVLERTGGRLSVKPGINDGFTARDLKVASYVRRFEVESREIYSQRKAILAACGLKPGERIADVGAGTGLFTKAFSRAVGERGWVFAIDIAPKFIARINKIAVEEKLSNVTGVVCTETSVTLPPASADVVFICDTYHHFEYPQLTLNSIRRALVPGGRLLLIDFERIPGKSRPWILGHVRAGKEVFKKEVESAGFAFSSEHEIKGMKENYCLIFRRK